MSVMFNSGDTKSDMNIEFEEGWAQIKKEAIEPLEAYLICRTQLNDNVKSLFTAQEYSRIYTRIYNMCTQSPNNWSRHLFYKYSETIEMFLREHVIDKLKDSTGLKLLFEFQLAWSNHLIYTHWMERFFGYLNKYYVKITGEGTLMLKGITIFYDTVYLELKDNISSSFSRSVQDYRSGAKEIDTEILKGTVNICLEMSEKSNIPEIYENEIEKAIIADLNSHYGSIAHNYAKNEKLLVYLSRVDDIINLEHRLCEMCLLDSTWKKIKKSLTQILLSDEMNIILSNSSSIKNMFVNNDFERLKLLYRLFSTISDGIQALSAQFKSYLIDCGQMVVNKFSETTIWGDNTEGESEGNSENNKLTQALTLCWPWTLGEPINTPFLNTNNELLFVQTIISLYDHSDYLMNNCFDNDAVLQKTIKESFEVIVNLEVDYQSQAKFACHYCDALLRNSSPKCEQDANSGALNDQLAVFGKKFVEIFSYIHFQDYFLQIYKFLLAKRLLQYHLSMEKSEQYIICLLKNKCGSGFTSKLEGMITDIQMTQNLNMKFRDYLKDSTRRFDEYKEFEIKNSQTSDSILQSTRDIHPEKIEFTVNVLTCSNWPPLGSSDLNLPIILKNCIHEFEEFYSLETTHRKLSWIHWYGQCTLDYRLTTPNGKTKCFEIHCNTYQACILLEFNDTFSISLSELQNLLNTDKSTLLKHIKPLYSDTNILKVINNAQSTSENFVFELNLELAACSDMSPIIVKLPYQIEATQRNNAECDKSHAIEAAIVRIMKVKGEMPRNDLVSYISSQFIEYRPSEELISSRINYLVEREYLANQQNDPERLIYLA
ncbi:cullin-like protein [Cryptosporidium canis]|uniref:Cullin-like protein n=1 Tax=Cryptosporidium canis TaxID=195482 RepID=A0ABQ8P5B9_9CRYT|nr:cullin-like protein [Cryptosporidium canis]